MTNSLVLTFIGRDRPGVVNAISEKIAAAGASWQESRLARLAGEFAGIVLVTVSEPELPGLTAALYALSEIGLRVTIEASIATPQQAQTRILEINVIGHDRPGIVRDMTRALNQLGANIEEFTSGIESAPFTGETLFRAAARLRLPDGIDNATVQQALERLADEIMVDFRDITE